MSWGSTGDDASDALSEVRTIGLVAFAGPIPLIRVGSAIDAVDNRGSEPCSASRDRATSTTDDLGRPEVDSSTETNSTVDSAVTPSTAARSRGRSSW